jgi:hypothetical protein
VVNDINASGDLLGATTTGHFVRAGGTFRWTPNCGDAPLALSDEGFLVGVALGSGIHEGFINTGRQYTRYQYPGADFTALNDVNASGVAVGYAALGTGFNTGFLFIPGGPLHIETPNVAVRWGLNTRQRIAWTYDGEAPQFQIEISRNNGRTWDYLTTVANHAGDSQNFEWQVTGPLTSAARFRVTAIGVPDATDVNDVNVRIARATIEMLSPTSDTAATFGSPLEIFYKHSLGARAPVAIDISTNNGTSWRTVAETRTTGSTTASFRWMVDAPPTRRARVRIRALGGSNAVDVSRAFVVAAAPRN